MSVDAHDLADHRTERDRQSVQVTGAEWTISSSTRRSGGHVGRREAHAELEHAERRTAGSVALRPERMWGL